MNAVTYAITPLDESMTAFLSEVQTNWFCKSDLTNGPNSEILKVAGMSVSVRKLAAFWNYQMPPYSWSSPSRNKDAAKFALIKGQFYPTSSITNCIYHRMNTLDYCVAKPMSFTSTEMIPVGYARRCT